MKIVNMSKLICFIVVVFSCVICCGGLTAFAQTPYIDLELTSSLNSNNLNIDETLSISFILTNNGPSTANNVTVQIKLPPQISLINSPNNFSSDLWQLPTLTPNESAQLSLEVLVEEAGIIFIPAEVTAANEFDPNSIPNNQRTDENDYTSICASIPISICQGETLSLYAPEGYSEYLWFENGAPINDENGNSLTINQAGNYTYQAKDDQECVIETPCPYIVNTSICETNVDCANNETLCRKTFYDYPFPTEICIDFCGTDLSIDSTSTLFNCSILQTSPNCFTYLPLPLFGGSDTISVYACNNTGACDTAYVFLTVSSACDGGGEIVNQPPVAIDDYFEIDPNTPNSLDLLSNDADPDGGSLELCGYTPPAHGTIQVVNGTLFYTPNPGYSGTDQFIYNVCDDFSAQDIAVVNLVIESDCAVNMSFCRPTFPLDPNANEVCIEFCQAGMEIVEINTQFFCNISETNGNCFSFVPFPLQEGLAEIEVVGCDSQNNCEIANVSIEVNDECGADTNAPRIFTEQLELANIITPNGDGINDFFNFENAFPTAFAWQIRIFNRTGSVVYESNEKESLPFWNGKMYGEYDLAAGTYFYSIISDTGTGTTQNRTGFIELRR